MFQAKRTGISKLLILFTLIFTLLPINTAHAEALPLAAECAILMEATTGRVLYSHNCHARRYPASTTKILTALVVLENCRLDDVVTVPKEAVGMEGSSIYLSLGERLTVEELLYGLMLRSGNDAATALAIHTAGSIDAFAVLMNKKAEELGCMDSSFVNPSGLPSTQHYTTAYDISLFMKAALEYDLFRQIIDTPSYTLPATDKSGERLFFNTNGLISNLYYAGYIYDPCIGGKTGSTDEAGRCLVSAAESGDTLLISVILGSGPVEVEGYENLRQGQFTESIKLLKHGFNNFERVTITKGSEPVDKVAVTLSRQADEVMVKPQGSITRTLPKGLNVEDIESEINLFSETVEAPVEAGQVLGTMKLSYEGEVYGTLDLVAVTSVERSELLYKKNQFIDFFQQFHVKLILVVILLVVIALVLKFTVFRKRRRYRSGSVSRPRGNYRGSRR